MNASVAPRSVESLFRDARRRLADIGIETADLDTSLLLEHATGLTVLDRITDANRIVLPDAIERFETSVERRLRREPVHRIIGEREFYGLPMKLNPSTLVPRPDTETLVDLVLPFVTDTAARNGTCRILDLGTGTGAIALALLSCVPQAVAVGADVSREALEAADANAAACGLADRFETVWSDWFEAITGSFDLIVSNPPYIPSADIAELDTDVRDHDPLPALDGGHDGLSAYRLLASQAGSFLTENGALGVEIGHDQKLPVTNLFRSSGFRQTGERKDYSGHDRTLFFVK
ncbi:peptide chain release factor N(5)-glutamine methyltransferase [Oricola indica]|uniref:peptide chain release factor N(5)-glutamine methyltransferase n=1 Tax=Oricola indica TaxID=2872591 RepID=UPI003CCBF5E7